MHLHVAVDVGGTFTDLVAVDATSGERFVVKVPSTPQAPEEGVMDALNDLFRRFDETPHVKSISHATTIATNALLGQMHLELPRVVFVTTHGFRDVIEIGRQNRSEVYNLFAKRPRPLVGRNDRIGVHERMDYRGEVLQALTREECERVVQEVRAHSPEAIAIGFLHSYANDAHERLMAQALRGAFPDVPITLSCDIDPEYREYERFSTAVVNAALQPIVQRYLERLSASLATFGIEAPLHVMQSNGGTALADRASAMPASIIESGPASGVIAAADLAQKASVPRALSFDMGGTTAKAGTIVDGNVQVVAEFEAAGATHSGRSVKGSGYPVRFPFVDLAEISAGGGTIAFVDEAGALRVGPLSAGADPGPACYGRAQNATATDANIVLGRLSGEALAGGTLPIDGTRSRDAIEPLARRLHMSVEEIAEGIVRIVDAQMAKVLRIVTVERGEDPRTFAMIAFGGNGPMHACALADELEIRTILIPPDPGVFSAHGLLVAPLRVSLVTPVMQTSEDMTADRLAQMGSALRTAAEEQLRSQGADGSLDVRLTCDARYRGQSFEIEVKADADPRAIAARFHDAHRRRYGYDVRGEAVELVAMRANAQAQRPRLSASPSTPRLPNGNSERRVWLEGRFRAVPVMQRASLTQSDAIAGPALIEQYDACTYVAPGWCAHPQHDMLCLDRSDA